MTTATLESPQPGSGGNFRTWVLACRPATLTASLVPVMVGTAVAHAEGGARLFPCLGALAGAMAIQIGTNLVNDVADFKKGADTDERLGPTRAVQAGLLSPEAVARGAWFAFGLAAIFGLYLTAVAGPLILLVGIVSILSGLAYTAGPVPLAYLGLGDIFVFLFFGIVAVMGTSYVQTQSLTPLALLASLPVGALATGILVVNNVRDRKTDRTAEKWTLVAQFGRRLGEIEFDLMLVTAYAVPVILWWFNLAPALVFITGLSLPMALRVRRELQHEDGQRLNATLAKSAQLLLVFGVLFAIGLF